MVKTKTPQPSSGWGVFGAEREKGLEPSTSTLARGNPVTKSALLGVIGLARILGVLVDKHKASSTSNQLTLMNKARAP